MKQLYRSRTNQYLAGVCGGLGEYFAIDANIIRLIFIIASFIGGVGFLAYFFLWLIVPGAPLNGGETKKSQGAIVMDEKNSSRKEKTEEARPHYADVVEKGSITGGLVLVILGVIFLLQNFIPAFSFSRLWPFILVVVGLSMIIKSGRK